LALIGRLRLNDRLSHVGIRLDIVRILLRVVRIWLTLENVCMTVKRVRLYLLAIRDLFGVVGLHLNVIHYYY